MPWAARLRAGHPLTEHDAGRLTSWQANLREGDLVVHYAPDSEDGFSLVPRRPGVDLDLIRPLAEIQRHNGTLVDILPQLGVPLAFVVVLLVRSSWTLRRSLARAI